MTSNFQRERVIPRIVSDGVNPVRIPEGTERSHALAVALAENCSEEFLQTLLCHKAVLDEFGGQIYVAAVRQKFDSHGNAIEHNDPGGTHETIAYVLHYSKTARLLKDQPDEPDIPYGDADPPLVASESNGTPPEPEPIAVAPEASPEE